MPKITIEQCHELIEAEYPLAQWMQFHVEALGEGTARIRMAYSPNILRHGGTIIGPAMMAVADWAMYVAIMTLYGFDVGVRALTTNMNTSFLRPPGKHDIIAECRVQKSGRRMCFLEVSLYSDGQKEPVAHMTGAYAIPPD